MATALLEILVKIRDEATQSISRLTDDFKNADISLKGFSTTAGMAAGALAAIGGLTFGMAIKAAEDAAVSWAKVKRVLTDTGVSFDDLRARAEEMAQKSTFQAHEIGEAYARNISLYGDTQEALDKTKMAMDIAAFSGQNLEYVQKIISRASDENIRCLRLLAEQLGIYIGDIDEHADKGEQFAILLSRIAAKAKGFDEELLGMSGLKETKKQWNELLELIGSAVLPALNSLLKDRIIPLIQKVKEWAQAHPELFKNITITTAAITALLMVLAPLLLALPGLIILLQGAAVMFGALTSPIGLVILALGALITAAIVFRKQFMEIIGQVVSWLKTVWSEACDAVANIWQNWVNRITSYVDFIIDKINWIRQEVRNAWSEAQNVISNVGQKVSSAVGTVKNVLGFQEGGIVTRPTLAMVGEAGPEAIIPLGRGGIGGNIIINLSGTFYTEEEVAEKFANQIAKLIKYQIRV